MRFSILIFSGLSEYLKAEMGSKRKSGGGGQERSTVEYKEKRLKNNVAVKKSRDKSKAKAREAQMRVQHLQVQNEQLQQTVDNMTSELRYLKDLLISQAGTGNGNSEDELVGEEFL